MCELGLRAGGAGTKRLVGRKELKRGLKALLAAPRAPPVGTDEGLKKSGGGETEQVGQATEAAAAATAKLPSAGCGRRGDGWSEQEVDDLLNGVILLGGGTIAGDANGNGGAGGGVAGDWAAGGDAELMDVEFREKLMLAISDGRTKADRDLEVAQEILPLCEKLQVVRGWLIIRLLELI